MLYVYANTKCAFRGRKCQESPTTVGSMHSHDHLECWCDEWHDKQPLPTDVSWIKLLNLPLHPPPLALWSFHSYKCKFCNKFIASVAKVNACRLIALWCERASLWLQSPSCGDCISMRKFWNTCLQLSLYLCKYQSTHLWMVCDFTFKTWVCVKISTYKLTFFLQALQFICVTENSNIQIQVFVLISALQALAFCNIFTSMDSPITDWQHMCKIQFTDDHYCVHKRPTGFQSKRQV